MPYCSDCFVLSRLSKLSNCELTGALQGAAAARCCAYRAEVHAAAAQPATGVAAARAVPCRTPALAQPGYQRAQPAVPGSGLGPGGAPSSRPGGARLYCGGRAWSVAANAARLSVCCMPTVLACTTCTTLSDAALQVVHVAMPGQEPALTDPPQEDMRLCSPLLSLHGLPLLHACH